MKGKLIVFEGVDGSGKTTLLNFAKDFFEKNNREIYTTKMPSDRVRKLDIFNDYDNSKNAYARNLIDLTNLTIFVSGDRLITCDTEIIPALNSGKIVLCDRYCYTGIARCNNKIINDIAKKFIVPDLVIYAKITNSLCKQRVLSRESEKNNFYDDDCVSKQMKIFDKLSKKHCFFEINTQNSLDFCKKQLYEKLQTFLK